MRTPISARGFGHASVRFGTLLTLIVAALACFATTASASRSYDASFGAFTANNGTNPQSLAVDQLNGDVYAVDIDTSAVVRFDADGNAKDFTCGTCSGNALQGMTLEFGPGATQVAIDRSGGPADGSIYVADGTSGTVQVFGEDGTPLGSLEGTGTPNGAFGSVFGVAVDQANGDLYVATGFGKAIWRYSPSAALVSEGDYDAGIEYTGFFSAANLAVAYGRIYVMGPFGPSNVRRYLTSDFAAVPTLNPAFAVAAEETSAIAVDPSNGDLYADKETQVDVYDASGTLSYSFGSVADFGTSAGVAVKGSGGRAYVADGVANEIDAFVQPAGSRSYDASFGAFTANNGTNPQSLAVDQLNGDVYAVDIDTSAVVRFDADGNAKDFTCGTCSGNALQGLTLELGPGASQVAIDRSGGPADGDIYVADGSSGTVQVFGEDGAPLGSLEGTGTPKTAFGSAFGVAVDQADGDLYVATGFGKAIWRYSPSAALVSEGDYDAGIEYTGFFSAANLAVAYGRIYVMGPFGPSNVRRYLTSDFAAVPTLNPAFAVAAEETSAIAVDPSNGDLYADKETQVDVYDASGTLSYSFGSVADFGTSAGVAVKGSGGRAYVADGVANEIDAFSPLSFGRRLTVAKAGPGSGSVTSSPPGIVCGPACFAIFPLDAEVTLSAQADPGSRLNSWQGCDSVAAEQCTVTVGADREVTARFTAQPTIADTRATGVGSGAATLRATVDPGGEPTAWQFEYTDDADFQANGFANATQVPASAPSVGSGADPVPVTRALSGLDPATTYHFRLVATNAVATIEGPGSTFTTFAPAPDFSGEDCGNAAFRTGPSANLPDCRAYEQATPVDKNGNDATGDVDFVQAADDGDAITFFALGGGLPGGQGAQDFTSFIARRGASSWSTRGLLPPASYGTAAEVAGWSSDLDTTFSTAAAFRGAPQTLLAQSADGSIAPVTPAGSSKGGAFVDASADDSLVYFESKEALTPEAVAGKSNLFVWNRETGTITLAGVLPDSACGGAPPCVSPQGSEAASLGYKRDEHVVSADGESVYFTDRADGQLYLRTDAADADAETFHVSASHKANGDGPGGIDVNGPLPARFHGAATDGSAAVFSSSEELTDESNTGPQHLPAIGRAELADGSNPELTFIAPQTAKGIAVGGGHIYWADPETDAIGRADLDGTDRNPEFITGADNPQYVALDPTNTHIYWTNAATGRVTESGHIGDGSIGSAELPANPADPPTAVTQSLLTELDNPQGIAVGVGSDSGHIYWADAANTGPGSCKVHPPGNLCSGGGSPTLNTIGRANVDGTARDKWFIEIGGGVPEGVAVDGGHVYFSANYSNGGDRGVLSRRDLDGSEASQVSASLQAPSSARGLALDAGHLYWSEQLTQSIGRVGLDLTTDFNPSFVTGVPAAYGLATDASKLYWASNPGAAGNPGRDLYRYEAGSANLTDLTPLAGEENGADVQGVLGISADAETVYFVANGVLAGGASPGDCKSFPGSTNFQGVCSLYVYRDGGIRFIARLNTSGDDPADEANWLPHTGETNGGGASRTARVSADGTVLLFRSKERLTSYDNTTGCNREGYTGGVYESGAVEDQTRPCPELYRFDAAANGGDGDLACVSCNPTGTPSKGSATFTWIRSPAPLRPTVGGQFLLRNLSASGDRVFFETPEKLVAADVNGDAGCALIHGVAGTDAWPRCQDVYEWEAVGSGSCQAATAGGGCLYLISSGTSPRPSFFADASADGDQAFFFTRDQLVPADRDGLQDIYAASVGGGLASQYAAPPASCAVEDCQGSPSPQPTAPEPGSAQAGPGNQAKPVGKSKAGKCAKKKTKKARKKCRRHHRSANSKRGGSK